MCVERHVQLPCWYTSAFMLLATILKSANGGQVQIHLVGLSVQSKVDADLVAKLGSVDGAASVGAVHSSNSSIAVLDAEAQYAPGGLLPQFGDGAPDTATFIVPAIVTAAQRFAKAVKFGVHEEKQSPNITEAYAVAYAVSGGLAKAWLQIIPDYLRYPGSVHTSTAAEVWRRFFLIPKHGLIGLVFAVTLSLVFEYWILPYLCRPHLQPLVWISIAAFCLMYIRFVFGGDAAAKWVSGYIYEWVFCIDDLFIFHFIFKKYNMPKSFASKALYTCLCGQLLTRFAFYLGLAHVIRNISIVHYIAGAVLVWNGLQALCDSGGGSGAHGAPTDMWLVKLLERALGGRLQKCWKEARTRRRSIADLFTKEKSPPSAFGKPAENLLTFQASAKNDKEASEDETMPIEVNNTQRRCDSEPSSPTWLADPTQEDAALFVVSKTDGKLQATLLVPVVLCMLVTDVVLGADCTIAKIQSIRGPFWNLSSSTIALFGIRSCYCWVAQLADKLAYIQCGIACVLIYIGVELIMMDFYQLSTLCSFGIIVAILVGTVIVSLMCSDTKA